MPHALLREIVRKIEEELDCVGCQLWSLGFSCLVQKERHCISC